MRNALADDRDALPKNALMRTSDLSFPHYRLLVPKANGDMLAPKASGKKRLVENEHLPAELIDLSKQMGIDAKGATPQSLIDQIWSKSPTDGVGEMIDSMPHRDWGTSPPWAEPSQNRAPFGDLPQMMPSSPNQNALTRRR